MFKTVTRWLVALAAVAAMGGASYQAAAEDYPEMTLRLAHFLPATLVGSQVDNWWAEEVGRRSGGKIKIKMFWSGSLGKSKELLDLTASGAVDLSATAQAYFPSELPLTGATNSLMLQFNDNEEATRLTAGLVRTNKDILAELERNNVYPIFFHGLNGYRPFCTKKIEKLSDFKGLKMRAWGEYVPVMWGSLGAVSVNALVPEIYEALQRGTLDCAFFSHETVTAIKLYEVAKFAWSHHLGALVGWPVWANWETWHKKWPENVKKLMHEVGLEAMERDIAKLREAEQTSLDLMVKEHGVQVVEFQDYDKLVATVPNLLEVWNGNMKKRGLGPQAQGIIASWKQELAKLRAK